MSTRAFTIMSLLILVPIPLSWVISGAMEDERPSVPCEGNLVHVGVVDDTRPVFVCVPKGETYEYSAPDPKT